MTSPDDKRTLSAEELEALRQWCASEGLVEVDESSIIRHHSDADDLTRRLLDEHAALKAEAPLAALADAQPPTTEEAARIDREALADTAERRKAYERATKALGAVVGDADWLVLNNYIAQQAELERRARELVAMCQDAQRGARPTVGTRWFQRAIDRVAELLEVKS